MTILPMGRRGPGCRLPTKLNVGHRKRATGGSRKSGGEPEPEREWTVMVYICGDNNLESSGVADVRETFRVPKFGTIAGCMVTEGRITRAGDTQARLLRDNVVVYRSNAPS